MTIIALQLQPKHTRIYHAALQINTNQQHKLTSKAIDQEKNRVRKQILEINQPNS